LTRTVALVGAVHPAARGLALALENDPSVERVLGLSAHEPPLLGPKFELVQASPGDQRFADALAEADTVVLFPLLEAGDRDGGRRARFVEAIRAALEAARSASTVVLWSSGVVYGAHPDNPVPITESQPLRPNAGFAPAEALAEAEGLVRGAAGAAAGRSVTILRAAAIWTPAWGTFLSRALRAPVMLGVRGYDPPVQALHPDDAVSALVLAATGGLTGTYNVAPGDSVPASAVAEAVGRRRVELPERAASAAAEQLRGFGFAATGPGELRYHMHPWALDAGRLRAAGWSPTRSTSEALADAARGLADGVLVGRVEVRRGDVYRGAAAALAVFAAVAMARRQGRRR
jgi:nucleoside-diphosphate-sugar epimerase